MKFPVLMINFKTYEQASGFDAEEITKVCRKVSEETGKAIACCPQATDIYRCAQYQIPIFAQHEDTEEPGGHTGKITLKAIKENGAIGSLINHSENRLSFEKINQLIHLFRQEDLISVVCVRDKEEAVSVAKLYPDLIAIEPPELIGGDVSVTKAKPSLIKDVVEAVQEIHEDIKVLCGAGVKTGEDVKKALELGAEGVLVASGVVKAEDKERSIRGLLSGFD